MIAKSTRVPGCSIILALASAFGLAALPNLAAPPQAPIHLQRGGSRASSDDRVRPFVSGEILVKLRPEAAAVAATTLRDRFVAETASVFRSGAEHWILRPGLKVPEVIAELAKNPMVAYAEPNYLVQADAVPDDPRYPELYGLNNTGQTGGVPGADIRAEQAWDVTTGSTSVLVAVIDTGVDYTHPDLAENMWTNPGEVPGNGIDDDGNGFVDDVRGWDFVSNDNDPWDDYGHGTHVAGTIGAVGNNGLGVVGVNWRVRIVPVKFLDASGSGTTANAIKAVEYATLIGADVTNNSWGGGGYSQALLDAINAAGAHDILFVAAAGNNGSDNDVYPAYPSSYDAASILAVAATDASDQLAYFSNFGALSVDLGAPGVAILSCIPGGGYDLKSGTSMATPHVAGIAALLRGLSPEIDVVSLKGRIVERTDAIPSLAGITVSGGRANAFLAVSDPDATPPGAIQDLAIESVATTSVTLVWTATGDDGSTGTASAYDLRYATEPITEGSFAAATPVLPLPRPQPAGSLERRTVAGLTARTTYYFAAKAKDEWGNVGPLGNVPAATTLPGVPEVALLGEETAVESAVDYFVDGAATYHSLALPTAPAGPGTLEVTADGDFGYPGETASVSAESLSLGTVGVTGTDCTPARGAFGVAGSDLATLAADGVVQVTVQNTWDVNTFCAVNRHQVRLVYRSTADLLDFGSVFVGARPSRRLLVENSGTDVLEVRSIASDNAAFVPSASSLLVPAGASLPLDVAFVPAAAGQATGTLTLLTNDADEATLVVSLRGQGVPPPDIAVSPPEFFEALLSGQNVTRVLTLSNTGETDLTFEIEIRKAPSAVAARTALQTAVRHDDPWGASSLTAAPGSPSGATGPGYADGKPPLREEIVVPPDPGIRALPTDMRILVVSSNGYVDEIRRLLAAFDDVAAVDSIDAYYAIPTLSQLEAYRVVILAPNSRYADPEAFGNVLADYVDGGGGVIVTLAAFVGGWEVRGRFLYEGYSPFEIGSGPIGASALAWYDSSHPIMQGVTFATGDLLAATRLTAGAVPVADWAFGQPFVATRGEHVVGVNVFVGTAGYWTGDVPLILHNAAFWAGGGTRWLTAEPTTGTIAAGQTVDVAVTFDAVDMDGGLYDAELRVSSNDPDEPLVIVPAHLAVTGAPDIRVLGEPVSVVSKRTYSGSGASTHHEIPVVVPPGAGGTIGLAAAGDYGDFSETATASAEGSVLGSVGGTGYDCGSQATGSFNLDAAALAALAADGVVIVDVTNSPYVEDFCYLNEHTVTLSYRGGADLMDFGGIFTGTTRALSLLVENRGTDVLEVAITSDRPEFSPSESTMTLAPRTSRQLSVTFSPPDPVLVTGTLTLSSNDPDQGTIVVNLLGEGLVPPDVDVVPTSISESLLSNQSATRTLTISNVSGSDLVYRASIRPAAIPGAPIGRPGSGDLSGELEPQESPGGPAATVPSAGSGAPVTLDLPFSDDFEDGDFAGWNPEGWGGREVTGATAADGTRFSYREYNSSGGHFSGVYRVLGDLRPAYFGFWVRPGPTNQDTGYFVVTSPNGYESIFFFARESGRFYVNGDTGGDESYVYEPYTWYLIEFRNVDFTAKTFDYWVNEEPVATGIRFRYPSSAVSAQTLRLYNYSYGAEAHWDEILLADAPPTHWITVAPRDGTVPAGAAARLDVRLDATGLDGGRYDARILVASNDPDEPTVTVPVTLDVTGVPDIDLLGETVAVSSSKTFSQYGQTTTHDLGLPIAPSGEGAIDVTANGDFGDYYETATVVVEGTTLGQVGRWGIDCSPARATFTVGASDLALWAADGRIQVTMTNSYDVDPFCAEQRHDVTLVYHGPSDVLDFGSIFLGTSKTLRLTVRNVGTADLHVTSVAASLPEFSVSPDAFTVPKHGVADVAVTFAATSATALQAVLTLQSDDPDEGTIEVALRGEGLVPPDIEVTPAAIDEGLFTGQTITVPLTIRNTGGSALVWSMDVTARSTGTVLTASPALSDAGDAPPRKDVATEMPPPPPLDRLFVQEVGGAAGQGGGPEARAEGGTLEDIRAALEEDHGAITSLIPNRFDFQEGEYGNSIGDGGNDMYDGGNYLFTNLGSYIPYSNAGVATDPAFGPAGRYFTRKYPGLFVAVADLDGVGTFGIDGNLGADGSGYVDGAILEYRAYGTLWRGYVKRVWGAWDPSVNHLIVVGGGPAASNVFSPYTDYDYHSVQGIGEATRVHYLLFASQNGGYVDDATMLAILTAYVDRLSATMVRPEVDSGVVPAGEEQTVGVVLDATDADGGTYESDLTIASNDPDEPQIVVPVTLRVTGVPDIDLLGEEVVTESVQPFSTYYAWTSHALPATPGFGAGGTLEVVVQGDFDEPYESATIAVEGRDFGTVGGDASFCGASRRLIPLSPAEMAALTADGVVQVQVTNNYAVDPTCSVNSHTVRLRYNRAADAIDFGTVFLGSSRTSHLTIRNVGRDVLDVTSIAADLPDVVATPSSVQVPMRGSAGIDVVFTPTAAGLLEGTLRIRSNDPDEQELTVAVHGIGRIPPDIEVIPSRVDVALYTGGVEERSVTVGNTGGSELNWTLRSRSGAAGGILEVSPRFGPMPPPATAKRPCLTAPPVPAPGDMFTSSRLAAADDAPGRRSGGELEDVLAVLDARYGEVTARIPNRFDFSEGDSGFYINDGGYDMYDGGNFLSTDLSSRIDYANGQIVSTPAFGDGSRYFTRKYPGLFVLVADLRGAAAFTIQGDLGADGSGLAEGSVLRANVNGAWYRGFVKRVWAAGDPSVNHLIIVPDDAGTQHGFSTYTNNDYHTVTGLPAGSRLHYLLFASWNGGYVDDNAMLAIMEAYLGAMPSGWLSATPEEGVVPAGGSAAITLHFDASSIGDADLATELVVSSDDPDESEVVVPVTMHVTAAPDIVVRGREVFLESTQKFRVSGAATTHDLAVTPPFDTDAQLEVTAEGDFDAPVEVAMVYADDVALGLVGATGTNCAPARGTFLLSRDLFETLAADGVVRIRIVNSADVDASCAVDRHSVRLSWRQPGDSIDFGPLFIGRSNEAHLLLENRGFATLDVPSIVSDRADFRVEPSALSLAPGGGAELLVTFAPTVSGPIAGALHLTTNDPDEQQVDIGLTGAGVIPPDIEVTPDALSSTLLIGDQAVRTLTVRNVGGSDLSFDIVARGTGTLGVTLEPPPATPDEGVPQRDRFRSGAPPRSDRPPEGYRPIRSGVSTMEGATVLMVADNLYPWGSDANQRLLEEFGVQYDVVPASSLSGIDLSQYFLILVPSDQDTRFYEAFASNESRIDAFVRGGGILQFHAAGWGFLGGNASLVTLPRAVMIEQYYSLWNAVLDPNHPLALGIPLLFQGTSASHAAFVNVPEDAALVMSDERWVPDLIVYSHGAGLVVAGGQTFEYGFRSGQVAGQVLRNVMKFTTSREQTWLFPTAVAETVVPPGGEQRLDFVIDARSVRKGRFVLDLVVSSNDPDEEIVRVPVVLNAVRLMAEAGPDQRIECDGGGAADVLLDGAASRHSDGEGEITAYRWSAAGASLGEGALLVTRLGLGTTAVDLRIEDETGDSSTDTMEATVVDTTPPSGTVTSPPDGACAGPGSLPLRIGDDFTDVCSAGEMTRTYSVPGGPAYSDHGDYDVALTVSDASGNTAPPARITFTIDRIVPTLSILVDPPNWTFPVVVPFQQIFADGDDDGARGGVVHEVVSIDGCVYYDGLTYGDHDGLLLDESATLDENSLCRLARVCNRRAWTDPWIEVAVTDCGGNITRRGFVKTGTFTAPPSLCP